jgi:hypothetical protein
MNEFQAWNEIIEEWKKVDRLRRLNQEFYDQLGDTFFFLLKYAEKNNIPLPNREGLFSMIDRLHERMHFIYPSDESYHPDGGGKSDDKLTESCFLGSILSKFDK